MNTDNHPRKINAYFIYGIIAILTSTFILSSLPILNINIETPQLVSARADFLIQYSQNLKSKDFIVKTEDMTRNKKGKRVYLNDVQTRDMMKQLDRFFESIVEVSRIRIGNKQTIETLINEETLLFAKYLRNEKKCWKPRLVNFKDC